MFTDQTNRQEDPIVETDPIRPPEPPVEAPDRGDEGTEAPEEALIRHAEAPDAGDCRADLIDQEYTHGRSMT